MAQALAGRLDAVAGSIGTVVIFAPSARRVGLLFQFHP